MIEDDWLELSFVSFLLFEVVKEEQFLCNAQIQGKDGFVVTFNARTKRVNRLRKGLIDIEGFRGPRKM